MVSKHWPSSQEEIRDFIAREKEKEELARARAAMPRKIKKPKKVYYTKEEWAVAREAVFSRDGRICYMCQCEATQVDHVLPKSKYPHLALDLTNLKPICWPCNRKKNTQVLTCPL